MIVPILMIDTNGRGMVILSHPDMEWYFAMSAEDACQVADALYRKATEAIHERAHAVKPNPQENRQKSAKNKGE